MGDMNEELILFKRLDALRAEHNLLDDQIDHQIALDEFTRQRLKRKRLQLRDEINKLEQIVYPDIIA